MVRLSGPEALSIAQTICAKSTPFEPRVATYSRFHNSGGEVLDSGLGLTFPGPASFTGEDVAELQGHGSPVVLESIVEAAITAGARMARPGEFSERAYLNGKMDLAQAEAVADLINAATAASARAAMRSLQGEFSQLLNILSADLVSVRVQVEAAIDFPDEDIELLAAPAILDGLGSLIADLKLTLERIKTGVRLTEGARLVLVGAPNVGKSSVLNRLCGEDRAIVTPIAGTTRDLVREQLVLAGIPVELVDTAGLRQTLDPIEAEGVRRANTAAREADLVLAIYDTGDPSTLDFLIDWLANGENAERSVGLSEISSEHSSGGEIPAVLVVGNKIDLHGHGESEDARAEQVKLSKLALTPAVSTARVSALTGVGIKELTEQLVGMLTGSDTSAAKFQANVFSARSRHLWALRECLSSLDDAREGISAEHGAELVAEHLRHAQAELGSVCGEISTDELLGEIFSSFCIGK